jgi:transposase
LPAYSPDFNPIEESFAALKAFIRRQPDFLHSRNPIGDIAWAARETITGAKCLSWIRHAGYALD